MTRDELISAEGTIVFISALTGRKMIVPAHTVATVTALGHLTSSTILL